VNRLRVVILKPSKYGEDGHLDRFRWGFMPNGTVPYLRSMTPDRVGDVPCEVRAIDEYVQTDSDYLSLLHPSPGTRTLLALVGVQSHQFHRALDLAAYAREHGVHECVIGGPHPMTCDTSMLQGRGVSFSLSEAEVVWPTILEHALEGELLPVYGKNQRWEQRLDPPRLEPPSRRDLRRYAMPMLGLYPARGCPYTCNFCSVIKIAGRRMRAQPVDTTLASLRAAKDGGVKMIMFCSDNFNKYPDATELLESMIEKNIGLPFFVQCDTQIERQEDLVELLARAGCFQMFIGVESFDRSALRDARKMQNHPDRYSRIIELCRRHGITTHFSNIIGFPTDTETSVLDHLRTLKLLDPDVTSFYVMTPIPGTDQYEDFQARGLITERNLDRFDATCPTWRHPELTHAQLSDLMFRCYREFYSGLGVLKKLWRLQRRNVSVLHTVAIWWLSRFATQRRSHPMAGGVGRVRLDRVEDYLPLRRELFGFDLAPLPKSLVLSAADAAINHTAKLRA
jgi:uncharacterized radical SAM superfamily protein